jgi:hypothetical protein
VVERARQTAELIETHGYDVVGELADLVPHATAEPGPHPDDVDADELADAAIETLAGLAAAFRGRGAVA